MGGVGSQGKKWSIATNDEGKIDLQHGEHRDEKADTKLKYTKEGRFAFLCGMDYGHGSPFVRAPWEYTGKLLIVD